MLLPSGENLGKLSTPDGELSLIAVPPSLGATHRSLAYVKTIWSFDTSGNLKSPASICAYKDDAVTKQLIVKASFLIQKNFCCWNLRKISEWKIQKWESGWFKGLSFVLQFDNSAFQKKKIFLNHKQHKKAWTLFLFIRKSEFWMRQFSYINFFLQAHP